MTAPPALTSFAPDLAAVVVGASGGIGGALTAALAESPRVASVLACSRGAPPAAHAKVAHQHLDLEDETTIAAAAERAGASDLVVVATGVLHDGDGLRPERSWRALDGAALERLFRLNAVGPALVAKHFLPRLRRERKAAFAALSARVGSIGDNRLGGWHGYRASKAALNMLIKTLSIELARRNPSAVCVALHPGTVATSLSAPFQANVADDKLFTPAFAAARLLAVIDGVTPQDSGRLFAWDGAVIPY